MNNELRALTDNELDAVSGGFISLFLGVPFAIGVAIGAGVEHIRQSTTGTLRPLKVPK